MDENKKYKTRLEQFGNLKPGDKLLGSDGQPVTVTNVYDKHYPVEMYEIEMEDGEVVQASGNHLWYCETTSDEWEKESYYELAKEYFTNNKIPPKEKDSPFCELSEIITLFGNHLNTQLFIEKSCRALGHSRMGPHVIIEDGSVSSEEVLYYSYNDLIEFLNKMKQAVLEGKGYFYFGEVRETSKIAELIEKGSEVNIPHRKEVE